MQVPNHLGTADVTLKQAAHNHCCSNVGILISGIQHTCQDLFVGYF